MEAKDGSASFDFTGRYKEIIQRELNTYTMSDGRLVRIEFLEDGSKVLLSETFDAEGTSSGEQQRTRVAGNPVQPNGVMRPLYYLYVYFDGRLRRLLQIVIRTQQTLLRKLIWQGFSQRFENRNFLIFQLFSKLHNFLRHETGFLFDKIKLVKYR